MTAPAEAKPKEKVPERRLWLYGSVEASPGTMGLYRTASMEPMGERLRLLYDGSLKLGQFSGNKHNLAGTARGCTPFLTHQKHACAMLRVTLTKCRQE